VTAAAPDQATNLVPGSLAYDEPVTQASALTGAPIDAEPVVSAVTLPVMEYSVAPAGHTFVSCSSLDTCLKVTFTEVVFPLAQVIVPLPPASAEVGNVPDLPVLPLHPVTWPLPVTVPETAVQVIVFVTADAGAAKAAPTIRPEQASAATVAKRFIPELRTS
jgi:hypothetical protein